MNEARRQLLLLAALSPTVAAAAAGDADASPPTTIQPLFQKLCEMACDDLKQNGSAETQLRKYYIDAYAIRALAVAYDLTGNQRYLQACQQWSDRLLIEQAGMTPKGAYYMNYGRKPGDSTDKWYVADCGSIAMGILATAARTAEPDARARYVSSVRTFADLVMSSYQKDGGITDGSWPTYDGPWWCSTGTFGSLAFLLYQECGEARYLQAGLEAVDWLNLQDFAKTQPVVANIDGQGPAFILYFFEAYSAGLAHMPGDSERLRRSMAKIQEALDWMRANLRGLGGLNRVSYYQHRGAKAGALPFHMYVWAKYRPRSFELHAGADAELDYITSILFDEKRFVEEKKDFSQLMHFSMFSMAERLSPGSIYRR